MALIVLATLVVCTLPPAVAHGAPRQQRNVGVDPNRQLGCQVHLPILNYAGQSEVCSSWLSVQVLGCEPAKAVLLVWAEPGFCPPQAAGPLKVECTGLLRPGSSWSLLGAQIPRGSQSGILFKFTARQLYQIGVDLGFNDVVADFMCETLFFGVVGDNDDYRRFKKAYGEGQVFGGIPMDRAVGGGFLAVSALRTCPGDLTPGVLVTSKYDGLAGTQLGVNDPVFGGYGFYAPLLYAAKGNFDSVIYLQNAGLECTSVEIWFKTQDDCLRSRICEVFTLAPGETYPFASGQCAGPDWQGSAWIRSSQPLAAAVDIVGRDVLMTYTAEPAEINYSFDPDQALAGEGSQVLFGPLIYSEYQGWDTGIQVQNLSAVVNAKVKVYFLDRGGGIITSLVDWVCPRGSQTFYLPVVHDLPGTWVGTVRIESQGILNPGGPPIEAPDVVGIATLVKYADAARSETSEAIAYNLLPEQSAFDWQLGGETNGGLTSGVGLIAIPTLVKDLSGVGATTEVAVANLVPKPGFTDLAIFIYDQNGLIDVVCEKLNDRQVEYINLDSWGYINDGFKGSAVVSAMYWEHGVFSGAGGFERNLVGLGVVSVERSSTTLGEDIPGDESAGDRGIPFGMTQVETNGCAYRYSGPLPPLCPGLPDTRPPSDCALPRIMARCTDCPRAIPDATTVTDRIAVEVPDGCLVKDVNVWLSIFHADLDNLAVSLAAPTGTSTSFFSGICPGEVAGSLNVILDDEAAQVIGSVCPASTLERWQVRVPGDLALFEGEKPSGVWTLTVADGVPLDVGTLYYWELQLELR